jgi:hypothetical protein
VVDNTVSTAALKACTMRRYVACDTTRAVAYSDFQPALVQLAMLTVAVLTRIRNSVSADLRPRDRTLREAIQAAISRITPHQGALSGASAHACLEAGRAELQVRADIIWLVIKRSYTSLVGHDSPTALEDLQQQIAEHLTAEARIVSELAAEFWRRHNQQMSLMIRDTIDIETRNELRTKYENEAHFFVDELRQTSSGAPAGASVVNIHGPVGSVQTGPNAIANVVLNASDINQLVEALESLRTAIQASAEMSNQQQAASLELVSDLIVATRSAKPNPAKIGGLLKGLAATVTTVASVQRAWDLVRGAAIAAHVWLSQIL